MAPTGRPSATIGDDEQVAGVRQERRTGAGCARVEPLDRQELAALPGVRDDRVGGGRAVGAFGDAARGKDDAGCPSDCTEDEAALEAEPRGEAVEDDPGLVDRVGDVVEPRADVDERWRSARRWRSSRSFIAEKIDVASANSQNEVTLRTGIRSNSIARPG